MGKDVESKVINAIVVDIFSGIGGEKERKKGEKYGKNIYTESKR